MSTKKVHFRETPVLEAAYCVHPKYMLDSVNLTERNKLKQSVSLIFPDMYTGDVMREFSEYKALSTPEQHDSDCICDAQNLPALGWWRNWGYTFPNLQILAARLSSMHQGNGPAERDWSDKDAIKTKRRNRLGPEKMNKQQNVRVCV